MNNNNNIYSTSKLFDSSNLVKSYLKSSTLIEHHIDSYNHFIHFGLNQIIKNDNKIQYIIPGDYFSKKNTQTYIVKILNPIVLPPSIITEDRKIQTLYPDDCRYKDMNYESEVCVDLQIKTITIEKEIINRKIIYKYPLCRIPTMIGSSICNTILDKNNSECKYNLGGYFIINGKERVLICQERNSYNKILVFKKIAKSKSLGLSNNNKINTFEYTNNQPTTDQFQTKLKNKTTNTLTKKSNIDIIHKNNTKYICEIRSLSYETGHSSLFVISCLEIKNIENEPIVYKNGVPIEIDFNKYNYENIYKLQIANFNKKIELVYILKVFGITKKYLILFFKNQLNKIKGYEKEKIIFEKYQYILINNLNNLNNLNTKTNEYIASVANTTTKIENAEKYIKNLLEFGILPHMNSMGIELKSRFIVEMIYKLLLVISKIRTVDDKDILSNKRIESSGILIYELFKSIYKNFIRKINLEIKSDIINVLSKYNLFITKDIRYAFATGNWNSGRISYTRVGVSQILARLSFAGVVSHLRRINIPIGKENKNLTIRQLHQSHAFFFCAIEVPEGPGVGIVKNFAYTVTISDRINHINIIDLMLTFDQELFIYGSKLIENEYHSTSVFINGNFIGISYNSLKLIKKLKYLRSIQYIHPHVSLTLQKKDDEIHIYSDEGRLLRPLIVVGNLHLLDENDYLKCLDQKSIIFVDSNEIENTSVFMNFHSQDISKINEYEYMELHPIFMFGFVGAITSFPDHNQSPRNVYYSCMVKQALCYCTYRLPNRVDTIIHQLHYTQTPLVDTIIGQNTINKKMPSGINVICAVMCYSGYNQEDSVILNQSSIDRGLFITSTYKTITIENNLKGISEIDEICLPDEEYRNKIYDYSKLDNYGYPRKGLKFKHGDILVGKTTKKYIKSEKTYNIVDSSIPVNINEEGFVDKIFINTNQFGNKIVKIRIKSWRIPELGDKFCSANAQKGTCGMVFKHQDMPFTNEGIVPDIIINPHAMPSRMTISQLLCTILGKIACEKGQIQDSTPFTIFSKDILEKLEIEMKQYGIKDYGNETMYNGFTGEKIKAKIFIGPTYYHKLKHMVKDKIYARNNSGNVQILTQQPSAGRSRQGALRIGEMERDSLIGHGVSNILNDRLFKSSDVFEMNICRLCKTPSINEKYCIYCTQEHPELVSEVVKVNIPFACKLLLQELQAMNIKVNYIPSNY